MGDLSLASIHLTSGDAHYAQHIRAGAHELVADEPVAIGGGDRGFAPYALLAAALAACTSATLQMYAGRKGWTIGQIKIDVRVVREGEVEVLHRTVTLEPSVTAEQRARLAEIAEKTPVTKTIKRGSTITTTFA